MQDPRRHSAERVADDTAETRGEHTSRDRDERIPVRAS